VDFNGGEDDLEFAVIRDGQAELRKLGSVVSPEDMVVPVL
jgi:hypothetical protein